MQRAAGTWMIGTDGDGKGESTCLHAIYCCLSMKDRVLCKIIVT
jgi:hypothetical protein